MVQTRIFEFEDGGTVTNPSWSEVCSLLGKIDGQQQTYGALYIPKLGRMIVGGGQDNKWIVYFEPMDGDQFPTLVDKSLGNETTKLIICGTLSEFPAYKCIDKGKMFSAFESFFKVGILAKELTWITD